MGEWLDEKFPKHAAVDVSEAMAEASEAPAEPVFKPANEHAVTTIVKRESVARESS